MLSMGAPAPWAIITVAGEVAEPLIITGPGAVKSSVMPYHLIVSDNSNLSC